MTYEEARGFIGARVTLPTRTKGTVGPGIVRWVSEIDMALECPSSSSEDVGELELVALDEIDEIS